MGFADRWSKDASQAVCPFETEIFEPVFRVTYSHNLVKHAYASRSLISMARCSMYCSATMKTCSIQNSMSYRKQKHLPAARDSTTFKFLLNVVFVELFDGVCNTAFEMSLFEWPCATKGVNPSVAQTRIYRHFNRSPVNLTRIYVISHHHAWHALVLHLRQRPRRVVI